MKKIFFAVLAAFVFSTAVIAAETTVISSDKKETVKAETKTETKTSAAPVEKKEAEKPAKPSVVTLTLGRADAPVVIDEYASLGCPHCQDFHLNTLPQLKATYIDSGRVKIVFHHFPLDKASVDAALLVHCVKPEQAWDVVNLLYKDQENWSRDPKYQTKLLGYGMMMGLTEKQIKACLGSTKKRDDILRARVAANKKLKIESTPTLVFNGGAAKLSGSQTFEQMSAIINKM